jgi:FAD/FMN-containing dehydrogenase
VSHTGGGLLLTGGVGYLTKAHGASADNILEVTIVTSDGSVHVCSKDNEPDLFFAVRGAAPNLGIVTQVKAKCYKHPDVTATLLAWPCTVENLKRLTNWSDQEAVLNDTNITPYIGFIPSPDKTPLVAMHAVCVGPPEEDDKYKALLGELEGTGEMALLPVSRVPFSTPQTIFDASFPTMYWYVSQAHNDADIPISDQSVEDLVEAYSKVPMDKGTHPLVALEQRGSKSAGYHQVASDDCAQPRAGQRWEIYVFFGTADQAHAETTRQEGRDMKQVILDTGFQAGGRVHLTNDEPSRIEYYYGSNSERVRAVVAKYDPIRLFASCNGMAF